MHIEAVKVENFRSILDSGLLSFTAGFNLIVGANNVGKSSLLLCIATTFDASPHRSIHTLPHRDDVLDRVSRVRIRLVTSGAETRRLLLNDLGGRRCVPWPADVPFSNNQNAEVLSRLLNADVIRFRAMAYATLSGGAVNWDIDEYPATHLYEPRIDGGSHHMLSFNANGAKRKILPVSTETSEALTADFGIAATSVLARKVYRFSAERLGLGAAPFGNNKELASDARNLPEVLNILQGNHEAFRRYCALVNEVFPTIHAISVRPSSQMAGQVEIIVWQVDPASQRDDLAMPLSQCGTGVGQVLAMLYVAQISTEPRCIIIDEPGSFLHPGASRALIRILKKFAHHQYIIATHSPEIISELSDSPVTVVRWNGSKSIFEQSPRTTPKLAGAVLTEVGARLSDVFGFDKILWVEGQSDALTFQALFAAVGKSLTRIGILPVRDTGSFRRRKIAEVVEIYRTLSQGGALLPPAVLFLFDREGRNATEINDAIKESSGRLRFLRRRMLESYILNAEAIALAFNEAGAPYDIATQADAVRNWIAVQGSRFCDDKNAEPFTLNWLESVDGAALLEELFLGLSNNRLEYRKTTHTPRIATFLFDVDPRAAQEIIDLVSDAIS